MVAAWSFEASQFTSFGAEGPHAQFVNLELGPQQSMVVPGPGGAALEQSTANRVPDG